MIGWMVFCNKPLESSELKLAAVIYNDMYIGETVTISRYTFTTPLSCLCIPFNFNVLAAMNMHIKLQQYFVYCLLNSLQSGINFARE